ncbi:hypothetical protein BTW07_04240 [Salinicola socius]|uniref:Uncharacterized protein n=3 Tax=Salinicola socius TaxID=404433 RepID=A0A1Q8SUX0_9GAMM|nr:hypothetical protein BTW07_04240 [Salinicola socius]
MVARGALVISSPVVNLLLDKNQMIKGVIFCVIFLVVQLIGLNYVDNRLNSSPKEARQVVTTTPAINREEKEKKDSRLS